MKKMEQKFFGYITVLAITIIFDLYITDQRYGKVVDKINTIGKILEYSNIPDTSFSSRQARIANSDIIYEYIRPKFDRLRKNTNKNSTEVLNYVEKVIAYGSAKKLAPFEHLTFKFPIYHQKYQKKWTEKELAEAEKKYNLDGNGVSPEVFYFHHGLRFANPKIKNYIKDKDILDCGAFIGDSVLVLKDYTDKTIFCYEFYKPCIEKFHKVMKLNNVISGYKLIPLALGESKKITSQSAGKLTACVPANKSKTSVNDLVDITTINDEAKKHNFKVGFIKVDVEGYALKVIKGAINTIKEQRPVLSLGIYHNKEELFETKPFLEKHLENYVFEFHLQQFDEGDMNELILFCYPKELQE